MSPLVMNPPLLLGEIWSGYADGERVFPAPGFSIIAGVYRVLVA